MLDEQILSMQTEIIRSVQQAVRIKSVEEPALGDMPFGAGVQEALEHCLSLSRELGFKTVNLDNMIGYAEYGQGEEMVAVLGHLDIVPEGEGWTYPPYAGEIHDGKIYGRGTTDDKGPTIGALYALKAIKDLRLPLQRRVRVFFGLNEETSAKCVRHYVETGGEIPVAGFTPDAEYPIINGEKGIVTCKYQRPLHPDGDLLLRSIQGGIAANVVPDYAQAVVVAPADKAEDIIMLARQAPNIQAEQAGDSIKIIASGVSAHGSTPEKGQNAISCLLLFLNQLGFSGDTGAFLTFFSTYFGMDINGRLLGVYSEDEISGPFTLNLGVINGDGAGVELEINMRYPVTGSFEAFIDTFRGKMEQGGFVEAALRHKKCLYVSPDTPFIKKLQSVYEEKTGDTADLISIGGGTYAKAMKNIVAFGPIFRGQPMVEHQPDEYINIDELIKNVQIMAEAIYKLAT